MEELIISGRRYISAKKAAEEYEYNPDYIGQLIRSKKIHGTKVGRAWYVDYEQVEQFFSRAKKISDIRDHEKSHKIITISAEETSPEPEYADASDEPAEVFPEPSEPEEVYAEPEIRPEPKKVPARYVEEVSISLPVLTKKPLSHVSERIERREMTQDVIIKRKTTEKSLRRAPIVFFCVTALLSSVLGYVAGMMFVTSAESSELLPAVWRITSR